MLIDGLMDWVSVDMAIGCAREAAAENGGDFKSIAIAVIEHLLLGGLMVPGDLGESGFEAWPGSPSELVDKVIRQCESFNWDPQGAACWLSNTETGDRLVS
ncbi:hypothetical protein OG205_32370 [Lentzea sp. NBC_00516]|uniref:hypothetical protein n=1 Tax=Lentzea sp. NBC_00516 TaxID=2903582 RepID=UPI002E80020E|nr:hypothetical protein [Lentzea sp. NBC_00516]WUD22745.1 hypothetical protein OG205_32370 [Lentzea sp. NBC_00516]